jgi:serine protease
MRFSCLRARWLTALLVAALVPAQAGTAPPPHMSSAAPAAEPAAAPAERFIVKLRATADSSAREAAPARIGALAKRNGLALQEARHIVSGIHLMRVTVPAGAQTSAQTLARLRADPEVEYAEVDERRHPLTTANDPLFGDQWYLQDAEPAAVDATDAWSVTAGVPGLVIADLDTGVRFDHPDLRSAGANRLLPGYNLISEPAIANNSYGRGPDASDPGDWVSASDLKNPAFANCTVANSSWHGTRVAGILGAITNNQTGIAGVTWDGWVEPVRVLGKCGGYDSDIIAGMAWAAGMPVAGVPNNPYPAQIVNMSLGAVGPCPAGYQQMVQELVRAGVLVVVSAGNEGGPVDAPANCSGATGVAGLRQVGTKVGYSSLGPQVALSAPAGNCVNTAPGQPCLFSIVTTTNTGPTVPETNTYTDEYNYNVGTSFSAPIVAGIAGLMLSVNGNLTPGQLLARLQAGTQTFPVSSTPGVPECHVPASSSDLQTSECSCTTSTCGAGMANANGALLQALRPIAAIALPAAVRAGSTVVLDGSGSAAACNATIVSYAWAVVQPAANPPVIQNASSARASVVAPSGSNTYTLMLTVTDAQGRADSEPVTLSSTNASTPAPATAGDSACLAAVSYTVPPASGADSTGSGGSSSGGGGGGGSMDLGTLLVLAGAALSLAATRRYSSFCAASSQGRCARR